MQELPEEEEEEDAGEIDEEGEGEDAVEVEEAENVQIASSGEEESLEKAAEPSQLPAELQVAPEPLPASSPEPFSSMPPAADVLVTQIGFEAPSPQGQSAALGSGGGADPEPARHVFSFSWLNSLNE